MIYYRHYYGNMGDIKMYRYVIIMLLVCMLVLSGCTPNTDIKSNNLSEANQQQSAQEKTDSDILSKIEEIASLKKELATIKKKLEEKNTVIEHMKSVQEKLEQEKQELISTIDNSYSESKQRMNNILSSVANEVSLVNVDGQTISDRFRVPEGFSRISVEEGSYAEYLRSLPVKSHGNQPLCYDGTYFHAEEPEYMTALDIPLDNRDLEQASDSAIRLHAEYLYKTKQYDKIKYPLVDGKIISYDKWMDGYRLISKDSTLEWVKKTDPSNTADDLASYLNMVYAYSNTKALNEYLTVIDTLDIAIGDMFVYRSPYTIGRCVMVIDMAVNADTHEKIALLAMSNNFLTTEIGILRNLSQRQNVCWFQLPTTDVETSGENSIYLKIPGDSLSYNWIRRF